MATPPANAKHDQNHVPTLLGVSSTDGVTPVPIEVDPTTGHLQVDATVSVSGSDGAILDGATSSIKASVKNYTNANPLTVRLTDTNGDYVAASGGTQYTDAAVAPAHPIGTIPVFNNAGTITAVSAANPLPVTANAGTNLNTSLLALEGGGNLASIKTDVDKIPSQGQALAAASMPVVLPAAQVTTLTPPTNTGYALDSSLSTIDTDLKSNITLHAGTNVIGHVLTDSGSTTAVTQVTAASLNATVVQGTSAAITGGWPTIAGETADTTGTFTNATQTTSITATSLSGYQAATVSINGTYGTGTAVFEGSDDGGTTWYPLQAGRTDSGTIEVGYTSLTNTTRMWTLEITGLDSFRVRSTAVASGTVNVRISISASPTSDAAVVSVGSALPAGTNVIGHVIADSGSTTAVTGNVAVTVADGSDTTLGAKADAKNTATDTTAISIMSVLKQISASVQAPPSQAVTNAGTFAVQAAVSNLPTTVDTNSGNKSASTIRVVLATDQPQLTNKLLVTPDANSAVNVAQINGVTPLMGVGATGTGAQRVVLVNDQGKTLVSTGGSASSSGNNTLVAAGTNKLKVYAFSLSTTSTTAMTCIFQSGNNGTELWRVILQAPTSISTGANLVVQPPAWLFATASATLLNLNLSSANAVHWAISYFDEA